MGESEFDGLDHSGSSEPQADASGSESAVATKTCGFEILDYGEDRADLHSRTEVKYTQQFPDLGKLRQTLTAACKAISHNERVSTVRSIYFDTPNLDACVANLHGLGQRKKLRLRWYDTLDAPADFFAEIKWRNNRTTGKHRFQMRAPKPLHELPYGQISRWLFDAVPEKHKRDVLRFAEPVVVVEYKREHFVSPDKELRMTMDYDLRFYDQMGKKSLSMRFPKRMDGFCVVEGKTPLGREAELKSLVHPLTPRADRCSKYVHGCRMVGHIRVGE